MSLGEPSWAKKSCPVLFCLLLSLIPLGLVSLKGIQDKAIAKVLGLGLELDN